MKKIIYVIAMLFGLASSVTFAQDWPQWRGINRDGNVVDFKAPKIWPQELKQQWKIMVGLGDSSPILIGNKLYVFARQDSFEILFCLDAKSGKELWRDQYEAINVKGASAALHSGPRSTPVYSEGKIVTLGVGGVLSCINAANGKLIWRKENTTNLVPQFYTGTSPVIEENTVFVHLGGKASGVISAFDLNSGQEKWTWIGEGPSYSSPIIMNMQDEEQVIFVTEKNTIGLDPDNGKVLWQVETIPQNRFYNAPSPVMEGQTMFFTGGGMGTRAFQVLKQGDIFVTKDIWNNAEVGAKYCTPVINQGLIYGISDKRKFYCMDATRGLTVWVDTTMFSDFGSMVNCGSVILAIPGKTDLLVISPDQTKYSEVARYKVSDNPIYTYPIIAGSRIYIKDKESVMQYRID